MEQERQPNGPYYRRPNINDYGDTPATGNRPQPEPPNALARASKIIGIVAVLSVFSFTVYPAIVLGSLAIILALLSRGASLKLHPSAKTGIQTSAIAIGINVALVSVIFIIVFANPNFEEDFNNMWERIYGMPYDEMMEGIENGTLDYDDIYENVYENMYDEMYEDTE